MHIPVVILAAGAVVCICTISSPFTWIRCCLNAGDIDLFFTVACFCIKQVSIKTFVYLSMAMRTPVTQCTPVRWRISQPCTSLECYWCRLLFSKQERLCSRSSDSDREKENKVVVYIMCVKDCCVHNALFICFSCWVNGGNNW
jgi:hypothetical protein